MAKMKNGWHGQTLRHSNAKRMGKAGGTYSNARIKKMLRNPEYKDLTYKQLSNKGIKLKYESDSDGDGVKNGKDCRPLNKYAQDDGKLSTQVKEIDTFVADAEKSEADKKLTKTERFKRTVKEDAQKLAVAIKEAEAKAELKYQEYKKKREVEKDFAEVKKVRELNTVLKNKVLNESEIDVRTLSDKELEHLAVIDGASNNFFSSNKYEAELKRRIKSEANLETDLRIAKIEAKKLEEKRIKEFEAKKPEEGFFDDFLK